MLEIDIEKRIVNGVWEGYIGRVNRQSIRVFTGKRMSGVELNNFFASGSLDNTKLKVYGPDGPIYLTYESIDISSPGSVAAHSPRVFIEERTLERFIDNFDQYVEGSSGVAKAAAQEALDAKDQLTTDVGQAINELNEVKESNRKRYLDPVATVAERDSAYPTPQNGDSVWVSGEGKMYRHNGTEWKVTNENDPSAIDMVNQQLAEKAEQSDLEVTDGRIDNLIATAGDGTIPSELSDIRVGQNGVTYNTAGEAVRKQFDTVKNTVGYEINTSPATKKTGFYLNLSGGEVSNAASFITDYIEVTPGMTVTIDNIYLISSRAMGAYDKDKNFIKAIAYGTDSTTLTFKVEEGWKYIRTTGAVSRGDIKASYTGITQGILNTTNMLVSQNKALSNFEGSKLLIGADLNALTFGAYYVDSNNVTQSLLNAPKGIEGTLKIIYIPIVGTKGLMYLVDAYSKEYVRQFNGSSWTGWVKSGNGITNPYHRTNIDRTELAPPIESFTPSLATWNSTDKRWELDTGGRISADINVQANVPYLITIGYVKGTNQMGDWDNGTLFDVVLGDAQISIYALNDANWRVMLIPKTTGTVKLTLGSNLWKGFIYSVNVMKINNFAIPNFTFEGADVRSYDTSIGIGMYTHQNLAYDASSDNNGKRNTAFGMRSQEKMDTGYDNTAVGFQTQMNMTNGLGNTAVGRMVQRNVTTGVYNTGVGWNAQANITTGNWNTALGLEAQLMLTTGVNNVSVGRRSSDIMTTGSHNVHIGAHSGFYPKPTIDSEGQVFVGQQTTQLTDGRQDRAIAIGQFAHADQDAIAIGSGVDAEANTIVIGKEIHETVKIAGKTIHFNADGSVTWTE